MAACEVETVALHGGEDDGGLWGRDSGLCSRVRAGRRPASWNGGAGGIGPSKEQRVEEEASGRGLRGSGEAGARRHDARELDAGSMGRRQCGVAVLRMRTHESRVGDSSTGRELSGD